MKVPVNNPSLSEEAKRNVEEALKGGWISSAGPFIEQFEKEFAKFVGVAHAHTASNGTSAIHLSLLALGIGPGDEVIVPAFTMGSSWMAVLYTGAKPVFVDCKLTDYNIDPSLIEEKISKKTKAIMVVHIYGQPAAMDEILSIGEKHKIPIIEDAAEAHGALYKGRPCGSMGLISAFSFYANKIITTGEGGMVVTNDAALSDKVKRLKDLCHSKEKRFIHDGVGYNYRMTNLQAAVGVGELANAEKYIAKKQWMAAQYEKHLAHLESLILPKETPGTRNVFWMYGIRINPERSALSKDELRKKLEAVGIGTRDFFYPPEDQVVLKPLLKKGERYPNAAYAAQNGFYVPSGLGITEAEIDYVCKQIIQALKA